LIKQVLQLLENQFYRFLVIGGINTVFGYSIYALGLFIGLHYTYAVLIATILGVLFNFKTIGTYVFNIKRKLLIFRFIGVYICVYTINIIGLRIFEAYQVNNYIAGVILVFPVALLSFWMNRRFVFF
jgi:putative flippase GtrA